MARTLPHNNEAEAAILGGILLRGEQALNDVMDIVREDDFYNPAHQAIFKAMKTLASAASRSTWSRSRPSCGRWISCKVVGGIEALNRLGDRYATSHNITHHAEMVRARRWCETW
jgi:replicative DNA helicase